MAVPPPPERDIDPTRGRVAGSLFLVGAVLTVFGLLLPHSPRADVGSFWIMAAAITVVGVTLLAYAQRLPVRVYPLVMLVASFTITLALFFNGERHGGPSAGNEVLYVWVALYAGYFFSGRAIIVQLIALAAFYAAALMLIDPGSVGPTRWLITTGMVCTAGALVHVLRMRNQRLVQELRVAARTDGLTGLANRQGFDELLEHELARARRTGRPTSLILADIDSFKDVNDRFGHPTGDIALREVGALATQLSRDSDVMARIGGDEFAAILPETDAAGALHFAEQLRDAVTRLTDPAGRVFTMSFGIIESSAGAESPRALMLAADRALYKAKRLGRNQSVVTRDEHHGALDPA